LIKFEKHKSKMPIEALLFFDNNYKKQSGFEEKSSFLQKILMSLEKSLFFLFAV